MRAPCTMHHAPCTMHHAPCTRLGEHVVVSEQGVDTELHQRRAVGGGEEVRVHVDHLGRVHLLHDHPTAWPSHAARLQLLYGTPNLTPTLTPTLTPALPPTLTPTLTPTAPPVRRPRAAASARGRGAPPAGAMPRRPSEARRPASGGAASTRLAACSAAHDASRTALCLGRALRRALRGALHGAWGMG